MQVLYNQLQIYNIEQWLQDESFATNIHIDNKHFDNNEQLVYAILQKPYIVIDAIETVDANRNKITFVDNYVLKTLIDYKNTCSNAAMTRKINLTTIYINILEVNNAAEYDEALELFRKLK